MALLRIFVLCTALLFAPLLKANELNGALKADYDEHVAALFDHFHRNPELSIAEVETPARMAAELRGAEFEVTENVGGTGVVALLKNGEGPTVMMRPDMDGLPIEEKPGLSNASKKQQQSPITKKPFSRYMPADRTYILRIWLGRRGA